MSIKANVGLGVISILTTDTVVIQPASPWERYSVSALSLHNDGSAGQAIIVEIFLSPDLTSASGERIDKIKVSDDAAKDVNSLIAQGQALNENIIMKADRTGCNAYPTVTQYDDGS